MVSLRFSEPNGSDLRRWLRSVELRQRRVNVRFTVSAAALFSRRRRARITFRIVLEGVGIE